MSTTYGAAGLGQTAASTRRVSPAFSKDIGVRFKHGAKNGANDRGNAPSCTA